MKTRFSAAVPSRACCVLTCLMVTSAAIAQEPAVGPTAVIKPKSAQEQADPEAETKETPSSPLSLEERRTQAQGIMEQFKKNAPAEIYEEGIAALEAFQSQ